jgi:hypothetical protein
VVQDNTVDVSNSVAQDNLVGVVTGKRTCTFHMGDTQSKEKGIRREAISLAGPVYGYVCNEGGALKAGDPITSSSKPGIGMKAARPCRIIGYAMQDEAFRDKDTAELMIFVKLGESVTPEYVAGLKANIAELKKRVARLKATPK